MENDLSREEEQRKLQRLAEKNAKLEAVVYKWVMEQYTLVNKNLESTHSETSKKKGVGLISNDVTRQLEDFCKRHTN